MADDWRYYQSGPLSDRGWRGLGFDDSAWSTGGALLYVESADLPGPKNTPLTLGQLVYYFRHEFSLPVLPMNASLAIHTILDDGMTVWLNGKRIFWLGMDDVDPDPDTLSTRTVGDAALEGPFAIPADALQQGGNVIAVEVHQTSSGSSDVVFGLSLAIEGGSVAGFTPRHGQKTSL